MLHRKPGGVTIPGEAGYEALTLRVAEKWGADVIRDSDGTALSERLLDSDYKIYSTVCVIRGHNAWLKEHPHCLQQTFLLTAPLPAFGQTLSVPIMREYDAQQFRANDSSTARREKNSRAARGATTRRRRRLWFCKPSPITPIP